MTDPFAVIRTITEHVNDKFPVAGEEDKLKAVVELSKLWIDAELVANYHAQEEDSDDEA